MGKRILFMAGVAALLIALSATIAFAEVPSAPFETNSQCLDCHDVAAGGPVLSTVDFRAPGEVDYNRCATCHLGLPDQIIFRGEPALTHYHAAFEWCGDCHTDDFDPIFALPVEGPRVDGFLTLTSYGFFAGLDSLAASPETLHDVHMNPSWVESMFSAEYPQCSRCHASAACSTCHTDAIAHGSHALPDYPGLVYKQATGLTSVIAPSTCVDPACHSLLSAGSTAFNEPSCLGCHEAAVFGEIHGYDSVNHVAPVAAEEFEGVECASCHHMDLMTEHEKPTSVSAGGSCFTCHPSPRDTYGAWEQGCQQGGCHAPASAAEPHAAMAAAHTPPSAAAICGECHGATLDSAHLGASTVVDGVTHESCNVCHRPDYLAGTADCTSCHFTFDDHYDEAAHESTWSLDGCIAEGCHTSNALMAEHEAARPGFTCMDCHAAPMSADAIAAGDTACNACHTSIVENDAHRAVHWALPPLVSGSFPNIQGNYSYYLGTAGGARTTDCAGCHTSNLVDEHMGLQDSGNWIRMPRGDRSGTAFDCATCHNSLDPQVMGAIALDRTACDACHTVHGPIPAVHASDFVADAPVDCSGCHSSDLTVVHGGFMTTVTDTGRTLAGCDICHGYYDSDGARGVEVRDAIAARDTSCTACHAEYHGDMAAHKATASASADDCGRCHGPVVDGELNVEPVHAGASLGACAVCHANPARIPDITSRTAECASCHAVAGETYHRAATEKHTFGAMDAGCLGAGCHVATTLPEEHERFLGRYDGYADTCALCHLNDDADRIDWATASAECSSCHEVHGDIDELHAAPGSQECVDCHASSDVRDLHGQSPAASCAVCHNSEVDTSGTAACVNCHDYSPVAEKHYRIEPHESGESAACASCHHLELVTEHERIDEPVDCVGCHTVDGFPAPWDGTCGSCHPQIHGNLGDKHVSESAGCGGDGCHMIGDASSVHAALPQSGCWACHTPLSADVTWGALSWTGVVPTGASLSFDVQGRVNGSWQTIPGHAGLSGMSIDLSRIDLAVYPKLRIVAHFAADPTLAKTPRIDSWAVTVRKAIGDEPESERIVFSQTAVAEFEQNELVQTVASPEFGTGALVLGTQGGSSSVTTADLLFAQVGRRTGEYFQYLPAENAWNQANSAGFRPSSQSFFEPRKGATLVAADGKLYLSRGDGNRDRAVYTPPPAGGTTGSWQRASSASHTLNRGSDAAVDPVRDRVYYTRGGEQKEILRWRPSTDTWDSAINFRIGWSDRSLSVGSAIAYSASADRLFVINRNRTSGDGRLYYLAAPSTKSGNQNFTSTGVQVTLSGSSERWNRMVSASVGGNEHLFILGQDSGDRSEFQVVSNLGASTPTLTKVGRYPFPSRLGEGADLVWDGGQYLYAIPGADRWEFARIRIPSNPASASAWGAWELLTPPADSSSRQWREGSCIGFLPLLVEGPSTASYYPAGSVTTLGIMPQGDTRATTDCLSCHAASEDGHRSAHESVSHNPKGCGGCHYTNLVDEHEMAGYGCQACHSSASAVVLGAIASGDQRCLTCHPDSPHNKRQAFEFNPANASGHNIDSNVWPKTSFVVNGQNYSVGFPTSNVFTAGWNQDSVMTCESCHTYDKSQATGPHGGQAVVNIDPAYPNPVRDLGRGEANTAQLSKNSPTGMSMSKSGSQPAKIICEKCHDLYNGSSWSNIAHKEHDDRGRNGAYCNHCHVAVPHGWVRPRLIGYRSDPAPYRTSPGGLTRITLRSYTPSTWSGKDLCGAECSTGRHPLNEPYQRSWP